MINFKVTALSAAIILSLTACSDDDDNPIDITKASLNSDIDSAAFNINSYLSSKVASSSSIEGTWILVQQKTQKTIDTDRQTIDNVLVEETDTATGKTGIAAVYTISDQGEGDYYFEPACQGEGDYDSGDLTSDEGVYYSGSGLDASFECIDDADCSRAELTFNAAKTEATLVTYQAEYEGDSEGSYEWSEVTEGTAKLIKVSDNTSQINFGEATTTLVGKDNGVDFDETATASCFSYTAQYELWSNGDLYQDTLFEGRFDEGRLSYYRDSEKESGDVYEERGLSDQASGSSVTYYYGETDNGEESGDTIEVSRLNYSNGKLSASISALDVPNPINMVRSRVAVNPTGENSVKVSLSIGLDVTENAPMPPLAQDL